MEQRGRSTVSTYERVAARVPSCQSYYELAVALGMGWVSTGRTQPQVKNLLVKLRKHGPKLDVSHFKKSPPGFVYPPVPRPCTRPPSLHPPRVRLPPLSREVLEPLCNVGHRFSPRDPPSVGQGVLLHGPPSVRQAPLSAGVTCLMGYRVLTGDCREKPYQDRQKSSQNHGGEYHGSWNQ